MAYVGFLVSRCSFGATIDYGILLYARYSEFRFAYDKRGGHAGYKICRAFILTSALILAAAGFGYAFLSTVGSIAELGVARARCYHQCIADHSCAARAACDVRSIAKPRL